ncbi:histone H4 [Aspergillus homomorphus CBS 101889]|uniref:Histone H4 n=1 Tax=Aspergillus homomorphus (strain CBS 101889) TaxID=1450537 RepID=A0A395I221_ASPHC|nr:putative histone H4 [Aspergillus homomorphus CBS 101889]RAL13997.1 putative histone H4 [Aspergillus homomorphus CBS 101889]
MDVNLLRQNEKHKPFMPPRKRFRKLYRDNIQGVTRPAICRLARRGGVCRISADIYDEARRALKERLTEIIRRVVLVMDSATTHGHERKVVSTQDVIFVLNQMGNPIYGFHDRISRW